MEKCESNKTTLKPLTRHASLIQKVKPTQLDAWLQENHTRCLSEPDLTKLIKEWDSYQKSDMSPDNRVIDSKLQVDVLNIRMETKIKNPQIRLKMGTVQYFTKRSNSVSGDWNEGFVFIVSYHAQLFNTIEFDLYDKPYKHWPTIRHIGKAKLKISTLSGRDDIFITFLPIYEYRLQRLLPSEVQQTLTQVIHPDELNKKTGDLTLIGSMQIRIRYRFQSPRSLHDEEPNRPLFNPVEPDPKHISLPVIPSDELYHPLSETLTKQTTRRSSYGRSDLAQEECFVDDLFKDRLTHIMTSTLPSTLPDSIPSSPSSSFSLQETHNRWHWIHQLILPSKRFPRSSKGRRYGFSQHDSDDSQHFNPTPAHKKAQHIIESVNFGDRDFASQWIQDSFEDVALSHPLVDKLIGWVVSKQTQAMIRAIIKTANAFGQGFRVTGIKLLKAFILTQKFYGSLPATVSPSPAVRDQTLTENACRYFQFALVAYGWRGLCYLGMYGQYVRGVRNRRSNRLAIIRYLHLDPEDLLGYEYALRKGASFQPSYFVAIDKGRHAIVLSIRGTWSLYDAITDLVCEYRPWKGGLVHSGMLASAQWFYTSIIPQIFRYIHHHPKIKSFIITGHSLGGGTASLLTMMVADHINELRDLAGNPEFELHCYNYAPAAVSSPELGSRYQSFIHSFVCQDDVVGRLSYGTAMKLKELVLDMISAYITLGGFRKTMTDAKTRKVCFDIISQRREKLNTATDSLYPSLYIPGKIIHIRREKVRFGKSSEEESEEESESEDQKKESMKTLKNNIPISKTVFSLHATTHVLSNEIKFTKNCIEDHMINSYYNAFEYLKEQDSSTTTDTHNST